MFLEIDDLVFVNLDNVFHISWQSYDHRGAWMFHAGAGEPHAPGPPATRWLPVQSRFFESRKEGEDWLRRALNATGMLLPDPHAREGRARRSHHPGKAY